MIHKQEKRNETADRSEQPRVIKTKQPLCWHYISALLESFRCTPAMKDSDFSRMFQELYELVSQKMELPDGGDIIDSYVVVEQTPGER